MSLLWCRSLLWWGFKSWPGNFRMPHMWQTTRPNEKAAVCKPGRGLPGFSPLTEEELRKLREETNAEMLRQELDRERQRRMELEQKVQEVLKAR